MVTQQCAGTTAKKDRCKRRVANGVYCAAHRAQHSAAPVQSDGFIYMYTYERLYDALMGKGGAASLDWLKADRSVLEKKPVALQRWQLDGDILVKIGMTNNPVAARLVQWRQRCTHPLVALTPARVRELQRVHARRKRGVLERLQERMRDLSLHRPHGADAQEPPLLTFAHDGFRCRGDALAAVEQSIHQALWRRYERAYVLCSGCTRSAAPTRHREWFKVPVRDLGYVLYTIDDLCLGGRAANRPDADTTKNSTRRAPLAPARPSTQSP
ncbi:ADR266Wp [Eremothecium gossypii ATCC 10895]|uniref:ADR266Wp n=1 Tax=Eremothecium gossypii (strain ATCC 10895 / CBS 109.51 / FGSC 9923 / NRRL Y-1056) TaxID=284811 RepID=Q759L0_EREGS|nr:ADR266Wp [Eremothecium gossypii ATCC 10895]AAS52186.2 ADR266Wp [Eremothecium gossypii ATCC 10895]AEY96485.1 FADR266Wp [Eremothecium gossypii FDAG1]